MSNHLYKLVMGQQELFGTDNPDELATHIKTEFPEGFPQIGGLNSGFAIVVGPKAKRLGPLQATKWVLNPGSREMLEDL